MNTNNFTPNNELNYLEIVMKGYLNPNSREHLPNYFLREYKKAEQNFYEAKEFFSGCFKIVEAFEKDIQLQVHKIKIELHFMLSAAKNKTIEYGNEDNSKTYKQRCNDTIGYCEEELKELRKNDFYVHLPSITNNRFLGNMAFNEVLIIEDAIVNTYQKIISVNNQHKQLDFNFDEIDFNQTSPEYFLKKVDELNAAYRVKFVISRNFIEQNGALAKGIKIGDIGTRFPEWPKNLKEAFELFKNYHAKRMLLIIVGEFLDTFYNWNNKAVGDELKKINQFIDEANEIDLRKALDNRFLVKSDYEMYLRLANGFYETKKNIKDDEPQARIIYAKYLLFRELLEKKIKSKEKQKTENQKQENDRILSVTDWCIIFYYLDKGNEFKESKKSNFKFYGTFISKNQIKPNNQTLTTAKYFKKKYHLICNRINGKENDMKEVEFNSSNPPLHPERIKKILSFIKKNKKAVQLAQGDIKHLQETIEFHNDNGYYE